ncbi:MAG: biopolymer transporter ExbD [Pseudomonadota bacterium]
MLGRGFGGSVRRAPEAKVMLTSMMDMFTIILVFLLYHMVPDEQTLKLQKELELPYSSSQVRFREAPGIIISLDSISIDDKVVATIRDGRIVNTKVQGNRIQPLYEELRRHKAITAFRVKKAGITLKEEDTIVLLQADKRTPYRLIDMVLKSAGMAGYPKCRLAVFRREV